MTVRLNKLIADSGLCSRREADRLIQAGFVTVNSKKVLTMGVQIELKTDKVLVKGHPLPRRRKVYFLFHKPKGAITTRKDELSTEKGKGEGKEKGKTEGTKRKTIYDVLPKKYAICDPAGRLDRDSTGALILTNDGDFLYRITHPRFHLDKVYRVRVSRDIQPNLIPDLLAGVLFEEEGKLAKAAEVKKIDERTLKITILTGMNRQIRRMLMLLGYPVASLRRISFGPVQLGDLGPGKIRPLSPEEMKALNPKTPAKPPLKKPSKGRSPKK